MHGMRMGWRQRLQSSVDYLPESSYEALGGRMDNTTPTAWAVAAVMTGKLMKMTSSFECIALELDSPIEASNFLL